MARSGPVTAEDFLASDIRERLAEIFNDAKLSLDSFSASVKSAAQETKNSLGKTLPETEAQLRLFNATLKDTERGTRDYYAILQQKKSLMEAERDMVPVITSAYDNLNSQYVKARNNARELGVMYGVQSNQFKQAATQANFFNDKLKSIDASMGSYQRSVGNYANATVNLKTKTQELVRGLGGLSGILGEVLLLFGAEGESMERVRRLSNELVRTSREMSYEKNIDKLVTQEGIAVKNKDIAVTEMQQTAQAESTVTTKANTVAVGEQLDMFAVAEASELDLVVVNEALIVSNEEVGASFIAAIPIIGWIIAGIAALVAIIYSVIIATNGHKEAIREYSKAVDGSVILDKKQRDEWNKHLDKMDELSDKYDVLIGKISEYQSAVNKVNREVKTATADLQNEWLNNMNENYTPVGFWPKVLNMVEKMGNATTGDFSHTQMENDRIAELTDQYWGQDGVITRKKEEGLGQIKNLTEENNKKMAQADSDYRLSYLNNNMEIAKSRIALDRNDYDRATKDRELERANAVSVLQEKQDTLTKLHSGDVDYTDKYAEISNEIGNINQVAHNEQLKADRDYAREHLKIMRDLKLESMKLSGNAVATEQKRYSNQVADIHADANSTPQEKNIQLENAERQHQEVMINIVYDYATKSANIRKDSDSLIQDGYLKEKQISQDTYDQKVRDIQKEYDLSAKTALDEYNYKTALSNAARDQSQRDFEYQLQRLKEIQALIDKNRADSAKNQSDYDKLHHPFDYKKQAADQTASVNATAQSQTDQVQGQQDALLNGRSKDDLMQNGSVDDIKQYQALEDEKTNIAQDAANKRYEIAQQLAQKEQELEAKRMTAILDATQETLNTENQLQMNNLKIQNDQLSSQAQVQATLAAEGRANSLAQVMKAQNDAAEAAKALQRKQAEEQEAMELAKLYISEKAAYVKGGDNPTQAALKALQDVLLTKAVAAGLSQSFAEGVERVQGPGTHTSDDIPAWLSKDESVITAAATLKHPGLPTALNTGKLDEWLLSNYLPSFPTKADTNKDEHVMKMLIDAQLQGTDKIVEAIKGKLEVIYTANGRIERENGNQTRVIVHNSDIIPSRRGFKR